MTVGNLGTKLLCFLIQIVILKFGFYGETKTGADNSRQNIILDDSGMKTGMNIYMDI